MTVEEKITEFREDLRQRDVPELVQRYITYGDCFALSADAYFDLKKNVGRQFGVHPSSVVVVGSAKLGFSIAPDKRYRIFGETSDIDVALCSSELFDAIWEDVFDFWTRGEQWTELTEFRKYLFRGWMRPDKLPPAKSFQRSKEWWEFFRQMTATGNYGSYKITGALYKTWHFLESYQQKCVGLCKEMEVISNENHSN